MFRHLFNVATLAIYFILLRKDAAVSATVCEDRALCEKNYTALEARLDNANLRLYQNYARLLAKYKLDKRQWNRIDKFTYELNNGCDFMPLNDMEHIWPYLACKWLGYNYDACITYMIYVSRHTENLPPLKLVPDCAESLDICNRAYDVALDYIARKNSLAQQMQRVLNDGMTASLTAKANQLEQQVKGKMECPQYNGFGCPWFMNCTREYQGKQQELENVLEQTYSQLAKFYEEQGKQLKLKEKLAVLIKQNSTQYGHCAIRPSSARNFASPYEGLFYYAYKYLHMSPSGCTTANAQLPPIPGATDCLPMLIDCEKLMKDADKRIEKEKDDLKCLTDLVANQTSYTALLKKLIENLEKDVQKKINSHRCLSCPDIEPCNKEYLELQKSLNEKNQEIQNEYLKKFEREDKKAVLRDKGARMKEKIRIPCNIVPVTTFKYVYPPDSCYWRNYLLGISLEQAIHSFTPNFEKLPDLTQVIEVTSSCTITTAECRKRIAEGKTLLAIKEIEFQKLFKANKDDFDITKYQADLREEELKYEKYAGSMCGGYLGDKNCTENLIDCKLAYNATQERFDDARSLYYKEITDYYELSGLIEKLKSVDASLSQQMEARCESITEMPIKDMIIRLYVAPHEDAISSQLVQLPILLSHGLNGSVVENCTKLLTTCKQQLNNAESRINGTKNMAKYYYELDKGKCAVARLIEYGIIKKIIALRELTAQNKYCYRVVENGMTITYLYDKKLI